MRENQQENDKNQREPCYLSNLEAWKSAYCWRDNHSPVEAVRSHEASNHVVKSASETAYIFQFAYKLFPLLTVSRVLHGINSFIGYYVAVNVSSVQIT